MMAAAGDQDTAGERSLFLALERGARAPTVADSHADARRLRRLIEAARRERAAAPEPPDPGRG